MYTTFIQDTCSEQVILNQDMNDERQLCKHRFGRKASQAKALAATGIRDEVLRDKKKVGVPGDYKMKKRFEGHEVIYRHSG